MNQTTAKIVFFGKTLEIGNIKSKALRNILCENIRDISRYNFNYSDEKYSAYFDYNQHSDHWREHSDYAKHSDVI